MCRTTWKAAIISEPAFHNFQLMNRLYFCSAKFIMKQLFLLFAFGFSALALQAQTRYGKSFESKDAITVQTLSNKLEKKSPIENVVVRGEIAEVCQAEGCWVKLKNPGAADIMVKFKDHAFLVPKDIAGKQMIVYGKAGVKKVSVAEQKHLAEDAGMSEKEIAAITQEKVQARIDAVGVVVE